MVQLWRGYLGESRTILDHIHPVGRLPKSMSSVFLAALPMLLRLPRLTQAADSPTLQAGTPAYWLLSLLDSVPARR